MANRIEIKINDADFRRQIYKMEKLGHGTKELKAVLRKSAKPWAKAANSSVYNYVTRKTGNMSKAIGIGTFESKSRNQIGVKARPKPKSFSGDKETNAGWRAHFFATPARQISPSKRIPWASIYSSQNGQVIANVITGVRALFTKLGIR